VLAGGTAVCARPDPAASAFEGSLLACVGEGQANGSGGKAVVLPSPRYDAVVVDEVVRRDGTFVRLVATRDPDGRLRLRAGDQDEKIALELVGSQLAIGDLDEDGEAEVVTTSESGDDGITIWSWRGHDLVRRLRIPAPLAVRALAVCPAGDAGRRPLVAVVGEEVWVVR
jgi:hypothetical protein